MWGLLVFGICGQKALPLFLPPVVGMGGCFIQCYLVVCGGRVRVPGFGFRFSVFGFRVPDSGFRVSGLEFAFPPPRGAP